MSSILNADHLAEQEQAYIESGDAPEQQPVLTLADVVDRLRRIAYHKRMITQEEEEAEALIAPLQAEIDRIREWQKERRERRERIIAFHEQAAVAYYRMNQPAKGKTIKLPNGSVGARLTPAGITFIDEKAVAYQLERIAPHYVRHTPSIDKKALKEAADRLGSDVRVYEDGSVAIVADGGEVVTLEGAKWKAPQEQYTVKVEEG